MKKMLIGLVVAVAIAAVAAPGALAATGGKAGRDPVRLDGTFTGMVYGDRRSKAPLTLELAQEGDEVTGTAHLGEGLYVDAGRCGKSYLPAVTEEGQVEIARSDPRRFEIAPSFRVSGFRVTVDLEGTLSKDGDTITADAKVDLPWFCGRDPKLTAELYRADDAETSGTSAGAGRAPMARR